MNVKIIICKIEKHWLGTAVNEFQVLMCIVDTDKIFPLCFFLWSCPCIVLACHLTKAILGKFNFHKINFVVPTTLYTVVYVTLHR